MLNKFTLIGLFMGFVMNIQAAAVSKAPNGEIVLENEYIKVVLLNPEEDLGCRFTKGGWLKNIYLKGGDKTGILENSSIFDYHTAFGFTEEFMPAPKLTDASSNVPVFFKTGVGINERPGKSRFSDKQIQLFPWQVEIKGNTIEYIQKSNSREGHSYTLKKSVSITDGACVQLVDTLENTGTKRLKTQVYIHPFFKTGGNPDDCWFTVPVKKGADIAKKATQFSCDMMTVENFCKDAKWLAGGNLRTGEIIGIKSEAEFTKVDIWKCKRCYALEPFIDIDLAPGETQTWNWSLFPGLGMTHISNISENGMASIERTDDTVEIQYLPQSKVADLKVNLIIIDQDGLMHKIYSKSCDNASPTKPASAVFRLQPLPDKYSVTAEVMANGELLAKAN